MSQYELPYVVVRRAISHPDRGMPGDLVRFRETGAYAMCYGDLIVSVPQIWAASQLTPTTETIQDDIADPPYRVREDGSYEKLRD